MEVQGNPANDVAEVESSPTAEVAESTTEVAESTADNAGIQDKPGKDGIQKRIDTLTWEKHEKAREAEYWRQMALEAQQQREPKEPEKPQTLPRLADFEYDEAKFQAAMIEYTRAEARREALEAVRAEKRRDEQLTQFSSFKQKEAEFVTKSPDYIAKVYDPANTFFTDDVARFIANSPAGPEIAYHLVENKDLAWHIANLPTTEVAREIGRLEARFENRKEAPKPKQKEVSAAPPPPPKIEAVEPEITKNPFDESMSTKEWLKWREKDLKRKKG